MTTVSAYDQPFFENGWGMAGPSTLGGVHSLVKSSNVETADPALVILLPWIVRQGAVRAPVVECYLVCILSCFCPYCVRYLHNLSQ